MTLEYLRQFGAKINPDEVGIPTVSANSVFNDALNLVYFFAGVACVIVIIVAGIMYATANGEADRITRAKNMILYAVVGLLVIMMAFTITWFVIGRF